MWKILSGISALLLLVSAFFAFQNNKTLALEKTLAKKAAANLDRGNEHKSDSESALVVAENDLKETVSQRDSANEQLAVVQASLEELNTDLSEKDSALTDILDEAKKAEDALDLIGEIKVIQAKLAQYTNQIADAEAKEASLKNLRSIALDQKKDAEIAISRQKQLVLNQSSGRMPLITASITSIQPEWGFAVISVGSRQGAVGNAKVDILRGNSVIGQGSISKLETGRSIVTILNETLSAGDYPRAGDRVRTASESVAPQI